MAFWGVELKPGKPYVYGQDNEKGRLHVSQATLGAGLSNKKSVVQCRVGDKSPIYLCSLLPERLETCALNLEFEEDDEVVFSVVGPQSVHLSGFFYGDNENHECCEDGCGSDAYEEDNMETDSEDEDGFIRYHSEDEDEDSDFSDDDLGMYSPSRVPNSGVKIEEIVDDEKLASENGMPKRAKKKKSLSDNSNENVNSECQIVKIKAGGPILESEDEDGFPLRKSDVTNPGSKLKENGDVRTGEKSQKKKEKGNDDREEKLKQKSDAIGQGGEAREKNELHGSSVLTDTNATENEKQKKKKNKKDKKRKVSDIDESVPESGIENADVMEHSTKAEVGNDMKPSEKTKEKKKKKKEDKQAESVATPNTVQNSTENKGSVGEKQGKADTKSLQVRSFPNGLVIEELVMGKPDGKRASPGKKVSVRYIGKLKKNDKIFDSNIGKAPFKFRLGIGQVIKGWDVGVNGMRIGDKRRLTIPPAMGYGAKGCPPAIPPNSWLVFDVELMGVN